MNQAPSNYLSDKWLFVFFYPICAIGVVHIGNDSTFEQLLQTPSYYTDLLLAFAISYIVGFYLRWLSPRITPKSPDLSLLRKTMINSFIFGIMLPLGVSICAEIIYLKALLNIELKTSPIFYLEAPLTFLFLLLGNSFYFLKSFYAFPIKQGNQNNAKAPFAENDASFKSSILVSKGTKEVLIEVGAIAHIELHEKNVYLTLHSGQEFFYNSSIQQMSAELDPTLFYTLNRQCIVQRKSIVSFQTTETRKLHVYLRPETRNEQFVSKAKAGEFVRWLKG